MKDPMNNLLKDIWTEFLGPLLFAAMTSGVLAIGVIIVVVIAIVT